WHCHVVDLTGPACGCDLPGVGGSLRARFDGQASLLVGHRSSAERRWIERGQAHSASGYCVRRRYSACPADSCRNVSFARPTTMRAALKEAGDHWLQGTNLWRERTNPVTGSMRLSDIGLKVVGEAKNSPCANWAGATAATYGSTSAGPRPPTSADTQRNWLRSRLTSSWLVPAPQPRRRC